MLMCFGSPLIDIRVTVDEEFLNKYSLKSDSAVRAGSEHETLFEDILSMQPSIIPGGSVTNTARIFQWIYQSPNSVVFVGAVGNDDYSKRIIGQLEQEKIDSFLVKKPNVTTGKCAVLISGTERHRSLVTDLGASTHFNMDDLQSKELQDKIEKSDYLYISTFFLGVSTKVTQKIFEEFRSKQKTIILNLGAPFLIEKYPKEVKYMFKNADLVVGNEIEFLSFARLSNTIDSSIEETIVKTNEFYPTNKNTSRIVIVTRGEYPIVIYRNKNIKFFDVASIENVVDTNGAGDAFVGGFLAKFVQKCDLDECVKCGIWCSKEILQRIGCDFDNKVTYDS